MKTARFLLYSSAVILCLALVWGNAACSYKFTETGLIPDSVKTFRVNFINNTAPYVNPQLSPALTDRLRQRILNNTRLRQVNNDNAHYDIHATIVDYSVSTTGVSNNGNQTQSSVNRLTVSVHITLNRILSGDSEEYDVSRNFDFPATQSLQTAEATLLDEIIRNLSDEIFNRIFSNW